MKFRKSILFSSIVLATTVFSGAALANKNSTVTFKAQIQAATCDVSANKDIVDFGTFAAGSVLSIAAPIATENFSLTLNNCTKEDKEDAANSNISLYASGNTLTGHTNLFADSAASQIGVELSTGSNIILPPNTQKELTNVKVTTNKDYVLDMTAKLMATVTGADGLKAQYLNVPVILSVAYN